MVVKKWLDSVHMWKIVLEGYIDRLNMECERKKVQSDCKVLDLSKWLDIDAID